ncbi:hypothetical protein BKA62DRAFT_772555 [Auriculariales sp. MPI-PUGE-AT-0066]|nr:hypothetical protein BKA62DRAFT_772555 [Auriculariales sp. MPI-PUGE-AT-0066]
MSSTRHSSREMLGNIHVAFLGTSAGECSLDPITMPSAPSATASADLGGLDGTRDAPGLLLHWGREIWMVDAGPGALPQLARLRHKNKLELAEPSFATSGVYHRPPHRHGQRPLLQPLQRPNVDFSPQRAPITRIFITHMQAAHVAGLPTLILQLLREIAVFGHLHRYQTHPDTLTRDVPPVPLLSEVHADLTVYGPSGLRRFIRSALGALLRLPSTAPPPPPPLTSTDGRSTMPMPQPLGSVTFTVHELLLDDEPRHALADAEAGHLLNEESLREVVGRDVACDRHGLWCDIIPNALQSQLRVSAGPVLCTVPSIGLVFAERTHAAPAHANAISPSNSGAHISELSTPVSVARSQQGGRGSSDESDDFDMGGGAWGSSWEDLGETTTPGGSNRTRSRSRLRQAGPMFPGRKIVVLGPTADASSLVRLCTRMQPNGTQRGQGPTTPRDGSQERDDQHDDPRRQSIEDGPTLLIATAYDAHLPGESAGAVRERCVSRGRSTAQMAGAFARTIGAKRVGIWGLGTRFPAISPSSSPAEHDIVNEMGSRWPTGPGSGFGLGSPTFAIRIDALKAQARRAWKPPSSSQQLDVASDLEIWSLPPENSTHDASRYIGRPSLSRRSSAASSLNDAWSEDLPPGPQAHPGLGRRPSFGADLGGPPRGPQPMPPHGMGPVPPQGTGLQHLRGRHPNPNPLGMSPPQFAGRDPRFSHSHGPVPGRPHHVRHVSDFGPGALSRGAYPSSVTLAPYGMNSSMSGLASLAPSPSPIPPREIGSDIHFSHHRPATAGGHRMPPGIHMTMPEFMPSPPMTGVFASQPGYSGQAQMYASMRGSIPAAPAYGSPYGNEVSMGQSIFGQGFHSGASSDFGHGGGVLRGQPWQPMADDTAVPFQERHA